jgi:hypothetical protein
MFGHFFTIPPLRSALPIHDMNIHKTNGIGENNTSAPIAKADQICRINIRTNEILLITLGFTRWHLFKSYSREERLSALCLFIQKLPINLAGMGGNGNSFFTQK